MSRTVLDSAMLLNVIAKPDARDWYSLPYEPTDYAAEIETPLKGKRIAFSPRMGSRSAYCLRLRRSSPRPPSASRRWARMSIWSIRRAVIRVRRSGHCGGPVPAFSSATMRTT